MLVPDAMANLALVPDGLTDEQVLMCPDIMSTGFSGAESAGVRIGDLWGSRRPAHRGEVASQGAVAAWGDASTYSSSGMRDRRQRWGLSPSIRTLDLRNEIRTNKIRTTRFPQ